MKTHIIIFKANALRGCIKRIHRSSYAYFRTFGTGEAIELYRVGTPDRETFSISANGHTRGGQTKLSQIRALQWYWFDRNSSIIANEATPKIRFDGLDAIVDRLDAILIRTVIRSMN